MEKIYIIVIIWMCPIFPSYGMEWAWGDDDEVTKSV